MKQNNHFVVYSEFNSTTGQARALSQDKEINHPSTLKLSYYKELQDTVHGRKVMVNRIATKQGGNLASQQQRRIVLHWSGEAIVIARVFMAKSKWSGGGGVQYHNKLSVGKTKVNYDDIVCTAVRSKTRWMHFLSSCKSWNKQHDSFNCEPTTWANEKDEVREA